MTREEAKRRLLNIERCTPIHTRDDARDFEALEMAIQALSQEPCDTYTEGYFKGYDDGLEQKLEEPCDDGNNLCSSCTNIGCEFQSGIVRTKCAFYMPPHIETDNCGNYVVMQPSVTQKSESVTEFADRCRECGAKYGKYRKEAKRWKNKWLKSHKSGKWIYDETIENWRCSKCNETPKTMGYVGTADFMAEHFKFCNHCGARMVESQERNDKE